MADGGAYRFHQPGTGQFYYPQHNQHNNHRNINRATSPTGGRRPFTNDTPSPSRSPVHSTSSHNTFNMYNHNGQQQGQHVMMNGGQNHQRYGMQMPKYQHQNHHQHHNHTNQHHNQHHQSGHMGHQHNYSSGNLGSSTPNLGGYGPNHNQNGASDSLQDEMEEPMNEHWQEQLQLAAEARQASSPHHYARTVAQAYPRANHSAGSGAATEDQQTEDTGRVKKAPKDPKQHWDEIDFGGQGLRALSDALFHYDFLQKLHLNFNKLDHLPPSIGRLKQLTHLDVSSNQLVELPEEVGMLTNLQKLLLFDNQIQTLPFEMGFLYNLEILGIQGNPLDEDLKTRIMHEGTKELIVYLRESMPDREPPMGRDWIVLDETKSSANQPDKFTALSYNILCERYATRSQYGYVPERVLNWDFRKGLILDEIRERDADIVCLQELDKYSYDEFFRTKLSYKGYKGFYAQKSRAETLGENAKYVDGCGIFWKEKKYVSLDTQHMVFGRKAVERPGAKASADMLNRVWQRDDIAVVTLLENRITGSRLIVVNAHIFWNPAFKDVQLIQVAVLMEQLTKLAEKYSKMPACTNKNLFRFSDAEDGEESMPEPGPSLEYASGPEIPMVICGDFNSGSGSAVYDLLTHGGISAQHSDLDERDYGSFSNGLSHPFTLKSAYSSIGELSFTNYTPTFTDVLDYIWFSSNSLRVSGLLGEVDKEYLQRVPGFPNFHFPSDHLALMAEFTVTSKKPGKVVEADFGPQKDRR